MTKLSRIVGLWTLVMPLATRPIAAQQTDSLFPRRNAWGAEFVPMSGAGSLLRFMSPRSAWVAGLGLSTVHQDRPASDTPAYSTHYSSFSAQLGHRWYLRATDDNGHIRPIVGLGLVGTTNRSSLAQDSDRQWTGGGYGEAGATWFFSSHISLGAVSMLQATTGRQRVTRMGSDIDGAAVRTTTSANVWTVSANITRVLVSVYF